MALENPITFRYGVDCGLVSEISRNPTTSMATVGMILPSIQILLCKAKDRLMDRWMGGGDRIDRTERI